MASNRRFYRNLIIGILIAIGGWALFNLAEYGITHLLNEVGITSQVAIYVSMIVIVVGILILIGYSFKSSLKKLVG